MSGNLVRAICAVAILLVAAPSGQAQPVRIDGSTGAMPLLEALARAYTAKAGVAFQIGKGLGTRARIDALKANDIDIAVASHGLRVDELVKEGMAVHEIVRTAVIFGVNAGIPIVSLTQAQICAVYAGAATNWKEIGGSDLPIAARTRPDSEVDAEVIRDGIVCLKSLKMPDAVKIMQRGGDMAKELATTTGAIGMTTTTVAEQSGGKIRALALDGVAPTEVNVASGTYRLVREVFLVVKEPIPPAVKSFLEFVRGPEGAVVIRANRAIPKAGT